MTENSPLVLDDFLNPLNIDADSDEYKFHAKCTKLSNTIDYLSQRQIQQCFTCSKLGLSFYNCKACIRCPNLNTELRAAIKDLQRIKRNFRERFKK